MGCPAAFHRLKFVCRDRYLACERLFCDRLHFACRGRLAKYLPERAQFPRGVRGGRDRFCAGVSPVIPSRSPRAAQEELEPNSVRWSRPGQRRSVSFCLARVIWRDGTPMNFASIGGTSDPMPNSQDRDYVRHDTVLCRYYPSRPKISDFWSVPGGRADPMQHCHTTVGTQRWYPIPMVRDLQV